MKLFKIVLWNKDIGSIHHAVTENDLEELELRTKLENNKNDNIIDNYTIQEVPLHIVWDITQLKGLSLQDLKKLILNL